MATDRKTRVRDRDELRQALFDVNERAVREWDALMETGRIVEAIRLARRYGVRPDQDPAPN